DALGVNVLDRRPFPDHHRFGREDFAKLGRPLVMTEKDAVKCDDLGLENSWALGVSAQLPPTWESAWLRTVEKLLSNN
ncbi:MAG: tetraacyldisaccharide 4'-kinase, partial [Pseudomonadota bacterium]